MVAVALAAICCATAPYLVLSPVATLSAATLVLTILAVARRGHDRLLIVGAVTLALITGSAAAIGEGIDLYRRCRLYSRLSAHYAYLESFTEEQVQYYDNYPQSFGGKTAWSKRRGEFVSAVYDYKYLKNKYLKLSRRPWSNNYEPELPGVAPRK
jgi:hypothetical protein